MAKAMGIRPHELYRIEDEIVQWSFDRGVISFGTALEAELQKISQSSKKRASAERRMQMTFDKWMHSADTDDQRGRFADPMDRIKRG